MEITSFISVEISSGKSKQGADEVKDNLKGIRKEQDETKKGTADLGKEFENTSARAKRASKETAESVKQVKSSIDTTKQAANEAGKSFAQAFVPLKTSADQANTSIKATVQLLPQLDHQFEKVGTSSSKNGKRAADEFIRLRDSINQTRRSTEDFQRKADEATSAVDSGFQRAGNSVKNYVASFLTITAAVAAFRSLIVESAEFEAGVLGVAKTTGLAGKELQDFASRMDEISREIPVSTRELLELAQAAGQMGISGAGNLEKFAVTVAKLGRTSDLAGEEAAAALARIINVTGESADKVDLLASVIVALGNSTAATEKEIATMANEMARSVSVFELTSSEIAGISAAMSSIGVEAALGGSSVGRAMEAINIAVQKGGDELSKFTSTLGLSKDIFAETFKQDQLEGFIMFLEAVRDKGLGASAALEDIGLGGIFTSKTIIPLANNLNILQQTLATVREEVENTSALEKEFSAVFDSFNNQWQMFKNQAESGARALGAEFMPALTQMLQEMNDNNSIYNFITSLDTLGKTLITVAEVGIALYVGSVVGARLAGMAWMANLTMLEVQLLSFAAAAGTANKALAFFGGPVGAIVAVSTSLMIMAANAESGTEALQRMSNEIEKLNRKEVKLAISMEENNLQALQRQLEKYEDAVHIAGRERAAELRTQITEATTRLEGFRRKLEEIDHVATEADWIEYYNGLLGEMSEKSDEAATATGTLSEALSESQEKTDDVIRALADELATLNMTNTQREIYNALLEAGANISAEDAEAIKRLVIEIENKRAALEQEQQAQRDLLEAERERTQEQKELAREAKRAEEERRRELNKTRDAYAQFYVEWKRSGESTFDSLKNSFKEMIDYMVGQMIASGIMEFFAKGSGGFSMKNVMDNSGFAGQISSAVLSKYAPNLATTLGLGSGSAAAATGVAASTGFGTAGAAMTSAQWSAAAGAGASATGAATAAGTAATGGIMSTIGAAMPWIAGAYALYSMFSKKETPSFNAGLLLDPTVPLGKSGQSFAVDAFESGITPTGFYRRSTEGEANQVIDVFRGADSSFMDILRDAGIDRKFSNEQIRGLRETGLGLGTGRVLGAAGEDGRPGMAVDQQVRSYLGDLLLGVRDELTDEQYANITSINDPGRMLEALREALTTTERLADAISGVVNVQKSDAEALKERISLQDELDELLLTEDQLRNKRRNQIDTDNRDLFDQLENAKRQKVVDEQKKSLQEELNELTMTEVELRELARNEIDATNQALFDQVTAARQAQEVESERKSLQEELNSLTLTENQLSAIRRSEIHATNQALFDQVEVAKAARTEMERRKTVERETIGLQNQLWQLTENTNALRARELGALDATNRALQLRIWAIEDAKTAFSDAMKVAGSAFEDLQDAVQRERDAITKTYESSSATVKKSLEGIQRIVGILKSSNTQVLPTRDQARQSLEEILRAAKTSGRLPDAERLQNVVSVLNGNGKELYRTFEEYQTDFVRTANDISELQSIAKGQEDIAETTLKTLEDQYKGEMTRLDNTIAVAQRQLDQLNGINRNTLGLADALARFGTAVRGAGSARDNIGNAGGPGGNGNKTPSYTDYTSSEILTYLAANNLGRHNNDQDRNVWEIYGAAQVHNADPIAVGAALGFTKAETEAMLHQAKVPGYALGSNEIEQDHVALLHKGEQVKPSYYVDLEERVREETNRILGMILIQVTNTSENVKLIKDDTKEIAADTETSKNYLEKFDETGILERAP
jgi:TP901 family phage tail tape measure protein